MKIDSNNISDLLVELLNINSPSGDTVEAVEYVKKYFEKLGLSTKITTKGALVATLEGRSKEDQVAVSAHVDTLGAMVKEIKSNGRLKLTQIGGYPWVTVDGEYCTIASLGGKHYRGTILHEKTSSHNYGSLPKEDVRTENNIEVRIDEEVFNKEDTEKLGIEIGDFVYLDPRTEVTESGFIKSRHLDDKACVAVLMETARNLVENKIMPSKTTHFFISNYEEVGHGAAGVLDGSVKELIAVDMASPGIGQQSMEQSVTICAKDSSGPYDLEIKKRLVNLSKDNEVDYKLDIYNYYGSDASAALRAGGQLRHGLIGPGVDASHAYERTHMKGLENTTKLLIAYLKN